VGCPRVYISRHSPPLLLIRITCEYVIFNHTYGPCVRRWIRQHQVADSRTVR